MGEMRNAYIIFIEKLEGKRPGGRPWRAWEFDISVDLGEMWWKDVHWMHLAQGRGQCGLL
jgi:hypothetical protein